MSRSEPTPAEDPNRITIHEKIAYGLGDTASNFFFQTFNLFLLYYYTDVLGLAAAAVGTMFLFTRVFDAAIDPCMGLLADRTVSRWGKFRPYLLWGAVPYGLIGYAMFANPHLSATARLTYAYVTYTLMMVAYTVVNIPYSALMGVMSPSSTERTSLSSYRFVCAFGGQLAIGALVLPLVRLIGGKNEASGFSGTIAIFAAVSAGLFLWTFVFTRERVRTPPDATGTVQGDLRLLMKNRPWLVLFFGAVFTLLNIAVRNGAVIYYFKYRVGSEAAVPIFWTLGSLGLIGGVASTRFLTARFDKRRLLIVLTFMNAAALAGFYFLRPTQLVAVQVLNVIAALLAGPVPAIVWSMYADCADYGEWRFGRRTTGLIFSASLFAIKLGIALGGALGGWLLAANGFVANAVQGEAALRGITLMFSLIPAGFATLVGLVMFLYPIDDKLIRQIEFELIVRRTGAAA